MTVSNTDAKRPLTLTTMNRRGTDVCESALKPPFLNYLVDCGAGKTRVSSSKTTVLSHTILTPEAPRNDFVRGLYEAVETDIISDTVTATVSETTEMVFTVVSIGIGVRQSVKGFLSTEISELQSVKFPLNQNSREISLRSTVNPNS